MAVLQSGAQGAEAVAHHPRSASFAVPQQQHEAKAEERELQLRIERAFGGERSSPYTEEEFAELARRQRCTPEDLRRRLVVQDGDTFFFFLGGNYSSGIHAGACEYALDALAAASAIGVERYVTTEKGEVRKKKVDQLVEEYGVVVEKCVESMHHQSSFYDGERKTFVRATCPLRRLRPERVPEVERYLEIVGSESLLDWLAFCPNLALASRALYMHGNADVGKSWFVKCLSRLWSTLGPTVGETLFGDFNDAVSHCPLVFMDEQLPSQLRGRRGTELFRRLIQETTRPYKAKFRAQCVLEGALRFILAANSLKLVTTDETLTDGDLAGIKDRLEVVDIPLDAGHYLRSLGTDRTARWFTEDLVAKHTLWLMENRDLPPLTRFGPARRASSAATKIVHDNLRFSGGTGFVMEWFYKAVTEQSPIPDTLVWGTTHPQGTTPLVNLDLLHQQLQLDQTKKSPPTRSQLIESLKACRLGMTRLRRSSGHARFHALDLQSFADWARLNDVDEERFMVKVHDTVSKQKGGLIEFVLSDEEA